jgi:hypothetical protein
MHMAQDQKLAVPAGNELDAAQADAVGGGLNCDAAQLIVLTGNLKQAYENLIDFTSHVIERVLHS